MHDEAKIKTSTQNVIAIADVAASIGVKIVVTNPSPIRWGGPENKTDAQLIRQAKALDALGAALKERGLTLAYHNHDVELRLAAREFHHMLTATDPAHVKFCLDSHWVFRGSGDSQVALFDALHHYADRIVELHLRQSRQGVWTEDLCAGDIDYEHLANALLRRKIKPHLVIEQAVEKDTPKTMDAIAAHRLSKTYAAKTFAALA